MSAAGSKRHCCADTGSSWRDTAIAQRRGAAQRMHGAAVDGLLAQAAASGHWAGQCGLRVGHGYQDAALLSSLSPEWASHILHTRAGHLK